MCVQHPWPEVPGWVLGTELTSCTRAPSVLNHVCIGFVKTHQSVFRSGSALLHPPPPAPSENGRPAVPFAAFGGHGFWILAILIAVYLFPTSSLSSSLSPHSPVVGLNADPVCARQASYPSCVPRISCFNLCLSGDASFQVLICHLLYIIFVIYYPCLCVHWGAVVCHIVYVGVRVQLVGV